MLFQTGTTIKYVGVFIANKTGATGLTVTVTVYRDTTPIITGAAATPIAKGAYQYLLAAASNTTADNYLVVFETTDTSVDCKMAYGLAVSGQTWVQNIDGKISDVVTNVWNSTTRTLTSYGTLVNDTRDAVWNATTRTLTGFGTLATDVRDAVWAATTRTLTAFGFSVSANNLPNDYALQTTLSDGLLAIVPKTNLIGTASVASRSDVNTARDVVTAAISTSEHNVIAAIEAGNAGTGPNSVTITVTDGTNLLQGAGVALTLNAFRYTATTNAQGQAVFSLDAGTYGVAISLAGYSFTPVTIVVDGVETRTYVMTQQVITPPTDPDKVPAYGYVRNFLGTDQKATITLEYTDTNVIAAQSFVALEGVTIESDDNGFFEFPEGVYPSTEADNDSANNATHQLTVEGASVTREFKLRISDTGGNLAGMRVK